VLALLWSKTPGAAYAGSDAAVSVTAYGAVCDGVTDDSARINSAIAAVYRAGGGDLTFPTDRICGITARLTLYPNVHLRGLGGSTIKLLANIGDYAIAGIAAHNSGVSDLTFDAGDYDGGPTSAAIAWQNSNGVSVRRVQIVNQGRFGIVLNGGANYDFLDNTISCRAKNSTICGTSAQNQAILVASSLPSGGGRIAGNTLTGSGMDIATANSAIVYNTITHWHFGGGITTEQASNAYGLTIVGNVTTGGIGTDANNTVVLGLEQWAPDSYIAFNYSADNDGDGIDIGGLNNTVDRNVTVDNSQIKKGLLDGIVCRYGTPDYNCSNSTFIGNRSYNSAGRDGPQKYAYAEQSASVAGVTLIGNDFPDNAAGGAHILSGSTQIR
jgi:polygalacturonase